MLTVFLRANLLEIGAEFSLLTLRNEQEKKIRGRMRVKTYSTSTRLSNATYSASVFSLVPEQQDLTSLLIHSYQFTTPCSDFKLFPALHRPGEST